MRPYATRMLCQVLTAFALLVPRVFDTHLRLGSAARTRLNTLLLANFFDTRMSKLISDSDDFVKAPFFWNADILPLFTRERVNQRYKRLNEAEMVDKAGRKQHLYSQLLSLLLRLSSRTGASEAASGTPRKGGVKFAAAEEIARRSAEVLDQFERNRDQQLFLLSIFDTLDARCRSSPQDFDDWPLTVLSEVAQNGVQTLSSVTDVGGKSSELCEQAMRTLLQSYISEKRPSEWRQLFKEAVNVAFMVKYLPGSFRTERRCRCLLRAPRRAPSSYGRYMFRESLPMARAKFEGVVANKENYKRMPAKEEVQALFASLVADAFASYGQVGIFDPARLAEIDFLNKPEQLVDLVCGSRSRKSRAGKLDMLLLTDITTKWMQYMVDRHFPPLTPHHTQALTVLMMSRFFDQLITPSEAAEPSVAAGGRKGSVVGKRKLAARTFVAQMSTGEGKSIVIAMLAVFVCELFDMKVHVLENNAGLLERDFRTNKPFYDKFHLKSGCGLDDLQDADVRICYCLKADINKYFLRKMLAGQIDEELGQTVLIVDEVDDLIVNERPNCHYVKADVNRTPQLCEAYAALKEGRERPEGVAEDVWGGACSNMRFCKERTVRDRHYRVIDHGDGKREVIMLDSAGNVPKVKMTAPWLTYLNFIECGNPPEDMTRHACVCTPYIFNKYKGIFGLTGSVGGKAELNYLMKTCFLPTPTPSQSSSRHTHAPLPRTQVLRRQVRRAALPRHVRGQRAQGGRQPRRAGDRRREEAGRARGRDRRQALPAGARARDLVEPRGAGRDPRRAVRRRARARRRGAALLRVRRARPLDARALADDDRRRDQAARRRRRQPLPRHRHRPLRRARPRLPGGRQGVERQRRHAGGRDVDPRRARVDSVEGAHGAAGPAGAVRRAAQLAGQAAERAEGQEGAGQAAPAGGGGLAGRLGAEGRADRGRQDRADARHGGRGNRRAAQGVWHRAGVGRGAQRADREVLQALPALLRRPVAAAGARGDRRQAAHFPHAEHREHAL
jgi:hypothetical protein